ncbi:DGQHR domain-containing protein [Roseateles sp. DAIF2]|uniref:DGQHR domain-containing protein DpdB n=1 Tax=Roseateles sp. DAIF2 TaxID=2714952 RepID=UPI0018A26EF9|nr:DGQHR domain-containing protein DpdB [Roseateles sp. DAIF2]QPF71466.1 DGQHR domain-containing protein [Roseateles sp. DAIF2]
MTVYRFKAIRANQAPGHEVFSFAAAPKDVLAFSEIERVGRDDQGHLKGFQRHQVASHIKDIRDYLAREDALLPNAVIVAFVEGADVKVKDLGDGIVEVKINAAAEKPGFVVDGQQRLSALAGLDKPGFQVFVSALVCRDYNELRQQFVLINNTRPLPKTLIYELLPTVEGLPERFTARKFAARIVDRLNFDPNSSLRGEIRQHTNPKGVLSDTAMQKLVSNSAADGAIREFIKHDDYEQRAFQLVSEFFWATREIYASEWDGMAPKTSRLKHGAGIVAMGFVMELLYSASGATARDDFRAGLASLKQYTSWTSGSWKFGEFDERLWNGIQNTPSDIDLLANYLVRKVKRQLRKNSPV